MLYVQIRVTLTDWNNVRTLYERLSTEQHLDAVYVFVRLRYERAFHFVACKTEVGS